MNHVRSVFRAALCLAVALGAAPAFAANKPEPTPAQAQLIDHAEYLCDNCFFGASTYFYCFAAGNNILIGYQKTPVFNYTDASKNYLSPAHPAWTSYAAPAGAIPLKYDDKHIYIDRPSRISKTGFWSQVKGLAFWVTRANDKKVKLTRVEKGDMFTGDDRCRLAGSAAKSE
jgi:hypothetical protein